MSRPFRHKANKRVIIGWWWLRWGYCPRCQSSPPNPDCDVCKGSYKYGYQITPEVRLLWWDRFRR